MKYLFLIISAGLLLSFFSSCRHTQEVRCTDGYLSIYGVGFNTSDFDSAMAYRYAQDNAFDFLIDSSKIITAWAGTDTNSLTAQNKAYHGTFFSAGYDYMIVLPFARKTYLITNITQSGDTTHMFTYYGHDSGPFHCYNNIVSSDVNSITYIETNTESSVNSLLYFLK